MGGAGPHVHDWGSERIEPCGISCNARQSPQVTCEARIPATETTPAAGVNVVVVVDGNCILQYTHRQSPCSCLSDGEPLLPRRPPPTYGAVPPSPTIPRGPACGQEAGPPPSRRTRGLSVRCCTKACLGDEEEHTERHLHRGAPCSRLTPVPLPRSPSGPWFGVGSLSGGRPGARVVRIWDRQRCPLLEEGDVIAKVNGADVRDLSPGEVESVLQEHTRAGDVILLVERKGTSIECQIVGWFSQSRILTVWVGGVFSQAPSPLHTPKKWLCIGKNRGHHSRRHPQENCTFRREHLLHDPTHNKGVPQAIPNPWGGPAGDTLAVTSFVGPEPRDVLVCPARCSQRLRRPRPAGGVGEPTGSVDGPKEEYGCSSGITIATDGGGAGRAASSLLPHQEEGPSHQEDGGLLARLSHGDVGGIFRQAGSRVRMRVRNRKDAGVSSDLNTADIEVGEGHRSPTYRPPQPQETGKYSVELLRGPNGFGFSLRGGSEYNMDIYVLALMDGGPAQQCGKIRVSDQLMEINGEPTLGMTHAQAVEHIRSGGSRIHLVLKRGNGFVPDYDREYSQSPAKLQQVPEAEDKARHRHRRPNLPEDPLYQGQTLCDGGGREASPSSKQQLPKTRVHQSSAKAQSSRVHQSSTKAQGKEEDDGEGGWRCQQQGKNVEGAGESCKLLSPRPSRKLRSDLVPGPWLVPTLKATCL
ncbi:PDZ domain-containing protein MAGIX isoform X2 [Hemicordylus capensis]|uniref:PDZ domain-containing protein MAGIX isoform X2 n=1 Tax=Hemicordylus capensis TaxID=884348 RepID=UPI002302302B|nr:PDZ domain-containing protein MAGIX isoform X2 [Hemicordylus capensis]